MAPDGGIGREAHSADLGPWRRKTPDEQIDLVGREADCPDESRHEMTELQWESSARLIDRKARQVPAIHVHEVVAGTYVAAIPAVNRVVIQLEKPRFAPLRLSM